MTGAAYVDQVKFTATAGVVAFVAGDTFTLAVAAADKYVPSVKTATDGSQIPCAVAAYDVDTTAGDNVGPCYFEGGFTYKVMIVDASWTLSTLDAAFRQNNIPIYVRRAGTLG